jgi:hypothetical protein
MMFSWVVPRQATGDIMTIQRSSEDIKRASDSFHLKLQHHLAWMLQSGGLNAHLQEAFALLSAIKQAVDAPGKIVERRST